MLAIIFGSDVLFAKQAADTANAIMFDVTIALFVTFASTNMLALFSLHDFFPRITAISSSVLS